MEKLDASLAINASMEAGKKIMDAVRKEIRAVICLKGSFQKSAGEKTITSSNDISGVKIVAIMFFRSTLYARLKMLGYDQERSVSTILR